MTAPRDFGSQTHQPTLWAAAQRLGTFTRADLRSETGLGEWTVSNFVGRLIEDGTFRDAGLRGRAQLLTVAEPDAFRVAAPPQRQQSLYGNLWTAMRGLRHFTALDLAAHASTEEVRIAEAQAAGYCRALLRAEYLRLVNTEVRGRRRASYRLLRNSGPLPPREIQVTGLYDPNEGAWTYLPEPRQ